MGDACVLRVERTMGGAVVVTRHGRVALVRADNRVEPVFVLLRHLHGAEMRRGEPARGVELDREGTVHLAVRLDRGQDGGGPRGAVRVVAVGYRCMVGWDVLRIRRESESSGVREESLHTSFEAHETSGRWKVRELSNTNRRESLDVMRVVEQLVRLVRKISKFQILV